MIESGAQNVVNMVHGKASGLKEIFWVLSEIQDETKDLNLLKIYFRPIACNAFAII